MLAPVHIFGENKVAIHGKEAFKAGVPVFPQQLPAVVPVSALVHLVKD